MTNLKRFLITAVAVAIGVVGVAGPAVAGGSTTTWAGAPDLQGVGGWFTDSFFCQDASSATVTLKFTSDTRARVAQVGYTEILTFHVEPIIGAGTVTVLSVTRNTYQGGDLVDQGTWTRPGASSPTRLFTCSGGSQRTGMTYSVVAQVLQPFTPVPST